MHPILLSAIATATTNPAGSNSTAFWSTSIGTVVEVFLAAIGVCILLVAILRSVTHVQAGKHGQAVRLVVGAAVVAAFCFDPPLINALIGAFTHIVSALVNSISGLASKGTTPTTPTTTPIG